MNKRLLITLMIHMIVIAFLAPNHMEGTTQELLTTAESSQFKATSRYQDVLNFIHILQTMSPDIKVETICTSHEGRSIPLVILGKPVPLTPLALKSDPRAVIYIQANIHAGEIEGKEASLMLMRDILRADQIPYLDKLVILFAPIFNADGNERISPDNRRNQLGPEQGVGIRYNGQNLDLNRDGIKLESPELQGLVQNVLCRWDPILLVDCHTTNGSYHEEPVTYSWPLNPNGDIGILSYMRDIMMPKIQTHLKESYNMMAIPYGNFMGREMNGWSTFSHHPRYVTNYIGLRNRLSILIENYAYAEYKTRVMGNYYYLRSILDYCYEHCDVLTKMVKEADIRTVEQGLQPATTNGFAVEFDSKPLEKPVTVLGWEMEPNPTQGAYPRMIKTDRKKTYTLPYYSDFVPKRTVPRPYAYLIPEIIPEVIQKIRQHGIIAEKLIKKTDLEVLAFQVNEIKASERLFQGHRMNTVTGKYQKTIRSFGPGTWVIFSAQPLGNLAAYLLEPESDDGLMLWNYFDRYLTPQWSRSPQTYPVFKLMQTSQLATEISPKE